MHSFFGRSFQRASRRKDGSTANDAALLNDAQPVPTRFSQAFKKYPEFPTVPLPKPNLEISLAEAVTKRTSTRTWSDTPLSLEDISNLLYYSCGTTSLTTNNEILHRAAASAGMKYPLEIYLIAHNIESLKRAVHHYDPTAHALTELWELTHFAPETFERLFVQPEMSRAACYFVITAIPHRTVEKYGERGYRYIYLEAGAVAHMLNVVGSSGDTGSVILGGVSDTQLEKLLDIDGEMETILITVATGKTGGVDNR